MADQTGAQRGRSQEEDRSSCCLVSRKRSQPLYNLSKSLRIASAIVAGHIATEIRKNSADTNGRGASLIMARKAFSWLERGLATGAVGAFYKEEPVWDTIRSDPRFTALVEKMSIPN